MKKNYFLMMLAAGALVLAGCKDDETKPEPETKGDSVSVYPGTETLDNTGGQTQLVVTSSGEWTISGGAAWATPSATKGKDGDTVKFTAVENETEEPKEAVFTFTVGKATATYKLIIKAGKGEDPDPVDKLDLVSDAEMTILKEGGAFQIEVDTDVAYRTITAEFDPAAAKYDAVENPDGWIEVKATTKADNIVTLNFSAKPNATFENRNAKITVKGGDAKVEVQVAQDQTNRLTTELPQYSFPLEGGSVEVQLLVNVPYDMVVDPTAMWLTVTPGANDLYTFSGAATAARREATVTFTAKDETLGLSPRTITIIQKPNPLITKAGDMMNNRAFPQWKNATPVTNLSTFTLETLVYVENFKASGNLNVIMGIEGKFLVRTGDVGVPNNRIQVCYLRNGSTQELKLTNSNMDIPAKTWTHIAVTHDYATKTVKCYVNGVEQGTATLTGTYQLPAVNFGTPNTAEYPAYVGGPVTRCFWLGYGYEDARYWPGLMSEVRIWNKALTAAEINAENHFYKVAADSEGLVAYWKMDNGDAGTPDDTYQVNAAGDKRTIYKDVIKDYTVNGNHLSTWSPFTWETVSIP